MIKRLLLATMLAVTWAGAASAASFDFSYSVLPGEGLDPIKAAGIIDATDYGGFYAVDNVAGTRGGKAITAYDYFDPTPQSFEYAGGYVSDVDFSYYVGAINYEVRFAGSGYGTEFADASSSALVTSFTLAPHVASAAVPEPGAWALAVGGLMLVGGALREGRGRARPLTA